MTPKRSKMLRLFIAIELPKRILEQLSHEQAALDDLTLRVRWARPEGIQLTLQFLGDVGAHRVGEFVGALEKAVDGAAPFVLKLDGMGAFPNLRRPQCQPRAPWISVSTRLETGHRSITSPKMDKRQTSPVQENRYDSTG